MHPSASQKEPVHTRREPALDDPQPQAPWGDTGHILETQGWYGVGNADLKAISLSHARSGAQGLSPWPCQVLGWDGCWWHTATALGQECQQHTEPPTVPLCSVGLSKVCVGGVGEDPHTSHSVQPDIASLGKSAQMSSEIKLLCAGLEKENPP